MSIPTSIERLSRSETGEWPKVPCRISNCFFMIDNVYPLFSTAHILSLSTVFHLFMSSFDHFAPIDSDYIHASFLSIHTKCFVNINDRTLMSTRLTIKGTLQCVALSHMMKSRCGLILLLPLSSQTPFLARLAILRWECCCGREKCPSGSGLVCWAMCDEIWR